jgi:hypothetical protein
LRHLLGVEFLRLQNLMFDELLLDALPLREGN